MRMGEGVVEGMAPGTLQAVSEAAADLLARARPSVVQLIAGNRGAGCGIVWRPGMIVTNHHVVAHGGDRVSLLTSQGTREATLVARDPMLDLALLAVPAGTAGAATIGNSSALRVGELLFALGHPWGGGLAATAGIMSGFGRAQIPGSRRTIPYIRSDVLLAPGNSGGPLLNAGGAVVGINAMIFGGDLSVAIPSGVVNDWLQEVDGNGAGRGPWL